MAPSRPRSPLLDTLFRGMRFFYLLWGGMLLGTLAAYNRVRVPAWLWSWPKVATFLSNPWGRGLLLGIGLAMSFAALMEVWELVDRLLVKFLHESDKDRP